MEDTKITVGSNYIKYVTLICDKCDMQFSTRVSELKKRKTFSCKTCAAKNNKHSITHGDTNSFEYKAWAGMKSRCNNPNAPKYYLYGGRGIKVCDRWVNRYETFLHDMGRKPSAKHSLDRIDSNGNYEPRNCRWATIPEQNQNRRHIKITFQDKSFTIVEWADFLGLGVQTIRHRLNRGWTVERTLTNKSQRETPS
jgi:hypothetical protein